MNKKLTEAYFVFRTLPEPATFVIKLVDRKIIKEARDILSGKQKGKTHVTGLIVKRPRTYNRPWKYHLKPESISFFEMSVEVCDATITYVEKHLAEVGGAFLPGNRWCPWSSKLVKEIKAPK